MKLILLATSLVFLVGSCRIMVPIDPNTGEPSARMLPDPVSGSQGVVAESK